MGVLKSEHPMSVKVRPKREDYEERCTSCHGSGEISYRTRVGGWAGLGAMKPLRRSACPVMAQGKLSM